MAHFSFCLTTQELYDNRNHVERGYCTPSVMQSEVVRVTCLLRVWICPGDLIFFLSFLPTPFSQILVVFLQIRQRRHGDLSSLKLAFFWTLLLICDFFASPVFSLIMVTIHLSSLDSRLFLSHSSMYHLSFYLSQTDFISLTFILFLSPFLFRLSFSFLSRIPLPVFNPLSLIHSVFPPSLILIVQIDIVATSSSGNSAT